MLRVALLFVVNILWKLCETDDPPVIPRGLTIMIKLGTHRTSQTHHVPWALSLPSNPDRLLGCLLPLGCCLQLSTEIKWLVTGIWFSNRISLQFSGPNCQMYPNVRWLSGSLSLLKIWTSFVRWFTYSTWWLSTATVNAYPRVMGKAPCKLMRRSVDSQPSRFGTIILGSFEEPLCCWHIHFWSFFKF